MTRLIELNAVTKAHQTAAGLFMALNGANLLVARKLGVVKVVE